MASKASSSKDLASQNTSKGKCIAYSEIEESDKITFDLNSKPLDLGQRHTTIINFLRGKASIDRFIFQGIPEAGSVKGCPLVEVQVSYRDLKTSFLITKSRLYIIGYCYAGVWYCFCDAEFRVTGGQDLVHSGRYNSFHKVRLGAGAMKEAMYDMQSRKFNDRRKGCEVFIVHFCEAARFLPIQNQVNAGIRVGYLDDFDVLPESECKFSWFVAVENPLEVGDLQTLISPVYTSDFEFDIQMFPEADGLVHSWRKLSIAWVIFCLTGDVRCVEEIAGSTLQSCSIWNVETLKNTLGILCPLAPGDIEGWEARFSDAGKEIWKRLVNWDYSSC